MFISKTKLLMAVLAVALIVPATAYGTDAWSDVPDAAYEHAAVTWAKANSITNGCDGGTNFCPAREVTRRENIAFTYRYDQEIVQPALADIQADADDNASAIDGVKQAMIYHLNPAVARNDTGGIPVTSLEINETTAIVSGDGDVIFPIDHPYSTNGVNWELLTVSPCYELSGGAVIDEVTLWTKSNTAAQTQFQDADDKSTSGCAPLFPDAGFVAGPLSLELSVKDGGEAEIYSIIVWWVHPDYFS